MRVGGLPPPSRGMGGPMEMTAIIAALLAAAGGLVVLAALGLRSAAAHGQDLLAAGAQLADRASPAAAYRHGPRARRLDVVRMWSRRPAWLFGMTAALGLLLIAAAAIGAGMLVEDATADDGVAVLDHPVASFVAAHRSGWLTTAMRAVSTAGGPVILAAAAAAAGALLGVLRRSLGPVLLAGATVAGAGGLTIMLKETLGRSRPPLDDALAAADGHAFPSAHAAAAAAVFGVLAYLCAARLRSWSARVAVWAGAAMLTALVGISRVYLGVHWATDVIGGWAFGVIWLAVVVTGWTIFTRHRRGRPGIPGPGGRGNPDRGPQHAGPAQPSADGAAPLSPPDQNGTRIAFNPSLPGGSALENGARVPGLSDGRPADRCDTGLQHVVAGRPRRMTERGLEARHFRGQ